MTKREQYLENGSLVKTIMMLVIVAFHSIANWGIPDWFLNRSKLIPVVSVLAEWMSSFHTSTFVFAAGFIFFSVSCSGNHYNSFVQFELKKAKRLLVPYVFVSILWCIPGGVFIFDNTLHDIVKKYGLGLSPAQLWFLLMLFGVYSIFYIVNKLFHNNPKTLGLTVIVIYAAGLILRKYIPNIFMIWRTTDMLPVFTVGYFFNKYLDKINVKRWMLLSAMIHMSLFVLHMRQVLISSIFSELIGLGMHVFGAIFMYSTIASLGIRFHTIKVSRYIRFLEKRSMAIYLIHQQLVWILLLFIENKFSPYICMPLIFVVVLLLSSVVASLLLNHNPTRIMIGEKSLAKGDRV